MIIWHGKDELIISLLCTINNGLLFKYESCQAIHMSLKGWWCSFQIKYFIRFMWLNYHCLFPWVYQILMTDISTWCLQISVEVGCIDIEIDIGIDIDIEIEMHTYINIVFIFIIFFVQFLKHNTVLYIPSMVLSS